MFEEGMGLVDWDAVQQRAGQSKSSSSSQPLQAFALPERPLTSSSTHGDDKPIPEDDPRRIAFERAMAIVPPFAEGRIALTRIKTAPRAGDISIDDIINKSLLRKACLSTYVIDEDWLFSKLLVGAKVCIARAKPGSVGANVTQIALSKDVMFIFPSNPQRFGTMHIKLMVLWFPTYLRVAVMSANLVDYDWETLENVVFCQDFKFIPKSQSSAATMGSFGRDLVTIMRCMGYPEEVLSDMSNYDYRPAIGELVGSVPGVHSASSLNSWGHRALGVKVAKIAAERKMDLSRCEVAFQTSSMGALKTEWLQRVLCSCRGDPNGDATLSAVKGQGLQAISIMFPSKTTVYQSKYGYAGGGTLYFSESYWKAADFPRHVMRDACLQTHRHAHPRQGTRIILCHPVDKIYKISSSPVLAVPPPSDTDPIDGWMYVGSHNATSSAWGASFDTDTPFATATPKFSINNWELGVVLPMRGVQQGTPVRGPSLLVPFVYPGKPYGRDDPFLKLGK
ncbi:tyrosyl-DNA phosphodiesterase I [Entophlyctis helioformis]|nr:tyrosyl-DNA phosphodiesterase I [Entophlyctis helioformis]